MSSTLSPAHLDAWRAFTTAYWRIAVPVEKAHVEGGLPPLPWYDVLSTLHAAPDHRLRMSALADRVLLSRSGLTRLVDQLEKKGLLKRAPCADDARGYDAALTPAGRKTLQQIWPVHRRAIIEHFASRLTPADAVQLAGLMTRLLSDKTSARAVASPPPAGAPAVPSKGAEDDPPSLVWPDFDPTAD